MSTRYVVGMLGAAEAIVWTISAPAGVDFTAVSVMSLAVTVTDRSGGVRTLSGWTLEALSASSLKATYLPNGTEFHEGQATFRATLTLDGETYRLAKQTETIDPY